MSISHSQFAAHSGQSALYKFRGYRSQTEKDRLREIVVDNRIYFSRASELNDPFDMSPRYAKPTRDELIDAAESFRKRHAGDESRILADRGYFESCDLEEHIARATADSRQRIENDYWVFSMAGNRTHPLLWSHYASGHTGVCLHFRCDGNSIFGVAQKVKYTKTRPILTVGLGDMSPREIFELIALTKGEFWSYEEEYRWLQFPDVDWSDVPIRFKGQHAEILPNELQGMTVGTRMRIAEVREILELAKSRSREIKVWRAIESDTFEFQFEELS